MKTILIASLILLASCHQSENINNNGRIKLKERNEVIGITIIEIDGIEYVTRHNGGIYPLVKDSTK